MADSRIVISGLWVAVMLTYLLGDVLRIFSGDFVAGEVSGMQILIVVGLVFNVLTVWIAWRWKEEEA